MQDNGNYPERNIESTPPISPNEPVDSDNNESDDEVRIQILPMDDSKPANESDETEANLRTSLTATVDSDSNGTGISGGNFWTISALLLSLVIVTSIVVILVKRKKK